jgi:hypothetical protein
MLASMSRQPAQDSRPRLTLPSAHPEYEPVMLRRWQGSLRQWFGRPQRWRWIAFLFNLVREDLRHELRLNLIQFLQRPFQNVPVFIRSFAEDFF